MKLKAVILSLLLVSACSNNQQEFEERIDAAIKLCQSESTKAYSHTQDGLRIMCHDNSSYIIRDDTSIEDIVELDETYCSSMGIKDLVSNKRGKISLKCKDGTSYIL